MTLGQIELMKNEFWYAFRRILTAAHCLCAYYDADSNYDLYTQGCVYNVPNQELTNQQTDIDRRDLNYISVGVGSKNLDELKWIDVERVYVMATERDVHGNILINNLYDIGLISLLEACGPLSQLGRQNAWLIRLPTT